MNRYLARAGLVNQLRAARDDTNDVLGLASTLTSNSLPLQIELVWPGNQTEAEAIYLLPSQGSITVPVFHGTPSASNPLTLEDDFSIPIEVKATLAGQTDTEAESRLEALVTAVFTVAAADPTLGGVPGLFWAIPGNYDGPGPARGDNGVQAYARIQLDCKARS